MPKIPLKATDIDEKFDPEGLNKQRYRYYESIGRAEQPHHLVEVHGFYKNRGGKLLDEFSDSGYNSGDAPCDGECLKAQLDHYHLKQCKGIEEDTPVRTYKITYTRKKANRFLTRKQKMITINKFGRFNYAST